MTLSRVSRLAKRGLGSPVPFHPSPSQVPLAYGPQGTLSQQNREEVVEYMCEVCDYFSLNAETSWAAVNYFDRFMCLSAERGTPVLRPKVEMVALSCVIIASKFLEMTVPALADVCGLVSHRSGRTDFKTIELQILTRLRWQLHVPTPHGIVDQMLGCAEKHGSGIQPKLRQRIRSHADIFISLSAFEFELLQYSYVEIGIACLICAYKQLNEVLPAVLRVESCCNAVGVPQEAVCRCVQALLQVRQGYGSSEEFPPELQRFNCVNDRSETPDSVMASHGGISHGAPASNECAETPDSVMASHGGASHGAQAPNECEIARPVATRATPSRMVS